MRLFINDLKPACPDPEDESYWDFMGDSLDVRRYNGDTRPVSIDLTMTTKQGEHANTTRVAGFRASHDGKEPILEITCDVAQAEILEEWLAMMGAVAQQLRKELRNGTKDNHA